MQEYDEAVLKCFVKNQLQLLPEKVDYKEKGVYQVIQKRLLQE